MPAPVDAASSAPWHGQHLPPYRTGCPVAARFSPMQARHPGHCRHGSPKPPAAGRFTCMSPRGLQIKGRGELGLRNQFCAAYLQFHQVQMSGKCLLSGYQTCYLNLETSSFKSLFPSHFLRWPFRKSPSIYIRPVTFPCPPCSHLSSNEHIYNHVFNGVFLEPLPY